MFSSFKTIPQLPSASASVASNKELGKLQLNASAEYQIGCSYVNKDKILQ